jgi:fermentation-respiration switch protein FrsA (DUF1100 family)
MRVIYSLIALVLVAYLAAVLVLWRYQERVAFQPPRYLDTSVVHAKQVRYSAADGTALIAYVLGDQCERAPVILAFHGNADLARWLVPWATALARHTGACVFLPEYRGYDGLRGAPTYAGVAADARAALAQARSVFGAPLDRFIYFGHSLGSAVAAELAAEAPPAALLLQSPFSSARAMAKRMIVPGLDALWTIISRVHYDTVARVRTLRVPVWVTHGDRDVVVPVRMGREVFAAAAQRGEFLLVPGAGHNDVDDVGQERYWEWMRRAITATVPSARSERRSAP